MGSDWKSIELDKLITKRNQGVNTTTEKVKYSPEGISVIRANNIIPGRIDFQDCVFVDEQTFSRIKQACKPKKGDVLYTNIGSQFGTAVKVDVDFTIAWNVLRIQTSKELDADFLVYLLNNPINKRYIQSLNYSSTMPFVSGKVVGGISFKLPNIEEQLKIRNALISFDKKIELNRQTNQTLEQMAQTLFKSWFVDFDPVFDKLLAKIDFDLTKLPSDFPEVLQKRAQKRLLVLNSEVGAATKIKAKASLQAMVQSDSSTDISNASTNDSVVNIHQYFPSEFEHNEQLGWIPKGWESGQIDTHAKIEMGQSPKGDTYNDSGVGTPLVNGPVEFGPYFTKQSKWTTSPTKLSKKNDLIVCVRGSTTGRYVKSNGEYCLGWGVCSIRGKKSQAFTDQLYKYSIREMLGLTTGSTFPNWSRQTLSEFKSIVPSAEALQLFDELVAPKIEKVEIGVIESQSLTQLRDTLLPKLISGELQIPDAIETIKTQTVNRR